MRKETKELSLSAMMAALGVLFLFLGGIFPLATFASPLFASFCLIFVEVECRKSYAWSCYAAIAVLGLILCADKEAAALFVFLGYYPLLQPIFNRISKIWLRWIAKIGFATVAVGVEYLLLIYAFQLQQVMEDLATNTPAILASTIALGVAVFICFDILCTRFRIKYIQKRKKK